MTKLIDFLKGAGKSKTIFFAVLLAMLGTLQMQIDIVRPWFDTQTHFGWFCIALSGIVAALRMLTVGSLVDKGAATDGTLPPSG